MAREIPDLVLLFFLYGFLGWVCEVVFAAVKEGKFINRGFLNGPICPIYGFGVVGVALALAPIRDNLALLFVGSFLLTTAIEFFTGLILEKLFHARWWDYSGMPLNIMGYVTLTFSVLWGAVCVVIVRWVYPVIAAAVHALPVLLRVGLDSGFGAVFLMDLCATVSAVRRLSNRLRRLTELGTELHAISDEIGRTLYDTTVVARDRVTAGGAALNEKKTRVKGKVAQAEAQISEWLDARRAQGGEAVNTIRSRYASTLARISAVLEESGFGHRRLLDAFPNLRSEHYQDAVESLRAFYHKHKPGKN